MRRPAGRVLGAVLALLAASPAAAHAAEPAAPEASAAAPAEAGPRGILWWNDPGVLEKLPLSADQRKRMDALFESYRSAVKGHSVPKAHAAYLEALRRGNYEQARREAEAWASSAGAVVRADAALKVGVFSLLSASQREKLVALSPRLVAVGWAPRAAWTPHGAP